MNLKTQLRNVTNGKKHITTLLGKYKNNQKVNEPEILELLQYHPIKNIDITNIEYLIIKIRAPFNKLSLYYKYKGSVKEDDISYVLCIKNLFGKYNREQNYEEDVMTAFRNESHIGSKKQFFMNNTKSNNGLFCGICDNCKVETYDITTDHFPIPFKQIFERFQKLEGLVLSSIDIFENNSNEIRIKNEKIASKWRIYHDEIATYRLLCKSCNSHFGSYETINQ